MNLQIDISTAAARLSPHVVCTPLLASSELGRLYSGRVLLKAEALQHTGSFKIRGALNRILKLPEAERRRGIVAWSSGNHAQGVAAAASMFGVSAAIVMPRDAPKAKIANTRRLGAEIVFYDRGSEDREAIARHLAAERGAIVIPSYDDFDVIEGQGTVGFEMVTQAASRGEQIDDILVPTSGGGLVAGIGLVVHAQRRDTRVFAVEPTGYDDHGRSLTAGQRVANVSTSAALCDALLASMPGRLTWEINRAHLAGAYTVTDEQVCAAMAFAFHYLKLVVEPGGAVALAAILSSQHDCRGKTVAVVLSGGNVDADTFVACVNRGGRDWPLPSP